MRVPWGGKELSGAEVRITIFAPVGIGKRAEEGVLEFRVKSY